MTRPPENRTRELIERLARINAADEWTDDLNPSQWAALSYLSRANRFSRSPSQVTEFMSATRGTVSQTLKALARKGLIEEIRSATDRRWISYAVTARGLSTLNRTTVIEQSLRDMAPKTRNDLELKLEELLRGALKSRGKKPFGQCRSCIHHKKTGTGGHCTLLNEKLAPEEALQICHEQQETA